mgnify:CR=1 FL=1
MTPQTIKVNYKMNLSNKNNNSSSLLIVLSLSLLTLGFIQTSFATEAQATIAPEPQAMPVEITTVSEQSIRLWKEFSGRLSAVDFVEVRPQASGLISEIKFDDGQLVKKGDILYIIDPRPFKAIVEQKKADYIAAQNRYDFAKKEHQRAIDLIKKKMVSQQVLDDRVNTKLVANSTVNRAKAELVEAEINLSYAYIKAPISGRVSRTELTKGNLVSAGSNAPLLTSIVANKSIYADFEVDEQTYLRYTNSTSESEQSNPVELRLQNGDHVYKGTIHAFDNKIDPASGTIRARAIFDNPQGKLLSGMYARLKLGDISEENTILISERAIGTDQNRKFVYVVNDNNKTSYRQVELGDSINGTRIVHSGLTTGDKVIVRGLMRIQPDMLVAPTELGEAQ